jgi:calcineurin-like phosphoesterase family protein
MTGHLGVPFLLAHKWDLLPEDFPGVYVHGHSHEKGKLYTWRGPTLMVNCCVEQTSYLPLTLNEIVAKYRLIESENPVDAPAP